MKKTLSIALSIVPLVMLSGCNNDSSAPSSSIDTFSLQTAAIVQQSSETTEPVSIDSLPVTQSETTEPNPI